MPAGRRCHPTALLLLLPLRALLQSLSCGVQIGIASGATIRTIRQHSGASVEIERTEDGAPADHRRIFLSGDDAQVELAERLLWEHIEESEGADSSLVATHSSPPPPPPCEPADALWPASANSSSTASTPQLKMRVRRIDPPPAAPVDVGDGGSDGAVAGRTASASSPPGNPPSVVGGPRRDRALRR